MVNPHDQEREDRIADEIIVDCYHEGEAAISWQIYFADNLEFPIKAVANLRKQGGIEEQKAVKIVEMASTEGDNDILLEVCEIGSKRIQAISPKKLVSVNTTEENLEVINDWLYYNNCSLL